jgi:hypothetical protein
MKSKKRFLFLLFFLVNQNLNAQVTYVDYNRLFINNIYLTHNNVGSLDSAGWTGAYWNPELVKDTIPYLWTTIVFDQGLWVIGKVDNEVNIAFAEWASNYSPGPILNGKPTLQTNPQDSIRFRVYKISKGDNESNKDYSEWPVDLGAPADKQGKPVISGDQMLWTVYNSLDSNYKERYSYKPLKSPKQLPLEVHEKIYGRKGNQNDSIDIFSNLVFFEWEIINKGEKQIDSAFIGFWTDIDFCEANANLPGVDIEQQLGYSWNGSDKCNSSNTAPCAVGYVLLYGPVKESPGNKAIFKGKEIDGFENLQLSSFHGILDDASSDPLYGSISDINQSWYIAKGLNGKGNVIINPVTGQPTKFPFDGDPVSNQGWNFPLPYSGGGAGFIFFSGPLSFAAADTQWLMIALVPALGKNRFESINLMRQKADKLRSLRYDSLAFGNSRVPLTSVDESKPIPEKFALLQNYPNPFNPSTTISYQLPVNSKVTLKLYNTLGQEVETLVNEFQTAGFHSSLFTLRSSLPSGVYFYQLKASDFMQTKKMLILK